MATGRNSEQGITNASRWSDAFSGGAFLLADGFADALEKCSFAPMIVSAFE